MKKLLKFLVTAVVVLVLLLYIPYYVNRCYDCEKVFVGVGYEPNILSEIIYEHEPVICKECAENQHVLSIALGKSVEEFRKPLFVDPVTMFCDRFEIEKSR